LDKKILRISPVEPVETLPANLSNINASLASDGQIVIEYRSGTDSVTGLLNQVKAAGISISDLRTEERQNPQSKRELRQLDLIRKL